MTDPRFLQYQRLTVELLRVNLQKHLNGRHFEFMESAKIDSWMNEFANDLVFSLQAYVCSKRTEQDRPTTIKVPSDWWQHCKERLFPAWALNRWPVVMRTIEVPGNIQHYNVCPHLSTPNDQRRHLEFLMSDPESMRIRDWQP